jgi:hypothetical protein
MRFLAEPFNIPVPSGDPVFDPYRFGNATIPLLRTQFSRIEEKQNSRVINNGFTAFMDCSGLYGNSDDDAALMRKFVGGQLKSITSPNSGETFPPRLVGGQSDGLFSFTISALNMVPQLLAPYLILFREHNRKAKELAAIHPDWTDEMLYQRARRWVIAVVQKTTWYFVSKIFQVK